MMYWILLIVFVLVNFVDLALTTCLMVNCKGFVEGTIESNYVANYVYEHSGIVGLILFKIFIVLLVSGISLYISKRSLKCSEFLLVFGIIVASIALFYSSVLVYEVLSIPQL